MRFAEVSAAQWNAGCGRAVVRRSIGGMPRALVVIDMQAALVPAMWRGDELAERLGGLVEEARANGVPVVYLQQDGPPDSPYAPGAPGWRLDARVRPAADDIVIRKTATDGFFRTELERELRDRGIDTLVVTGVASDFCVDSTVRSALSHGFDVQLVTDGHSTGERPGLTPEDIIAHHNGVLGFGTHPGGTVELVASADVFAGRDVVSEQPAGPLDRPGSLGEESSHGHPLR
jgi:nicotinamidase-related amidase